LEDSNRLRIVIADGQYFFRKGLRTVLSDEADFQVTGEAANFEECLSALQSFSPDVILLEASLADDSMRAALRAVKPSIALLFLANEISANSLTISGEAFLLKNEASAQVVAAIRRIAGRTPAGSPGSANSAADLRALATSTSAFATVPGLTARESEIVKILAQGHSAREVAEELGLSIKTVEAHKLNVMRKLGVHNRAALIRYAAQHSVSEIL
jgi:two-component system response regulator NreC